MRPECTAPTSNLSKITMANLLVTMGIVFGDIGTSPLYVMKAIVGVRPDYSSAYILGAISCVIWTLTLQTTLKYVVIALRADNKGEGGILALFSLLRKVPPRWLYIVAAVGASALVADGVITPAITVSSAIEGLAIVVPGVPVRAVVVAVILLIFIIQQAGTGKIGRWFGSFMLLWFAMLGVLGAIAVPQCLTVMKAFNPWWAVKLLAESPEWFFIMGGVFLCTTGAEALYSDLGHCGRGNITVSWVFVKVMLILNYLGQGAWLMSREGTTLGGVNPFYGIMPGWFTLVGVVMAAGAAVIASQALLSGSFTIFSEAINLNFWPKLRIKYPTPERGQLFVPSVNLCLLAGCLLTVAIFGDSSHMEAAYGLAITVTMLMTTVLLTVWLRMKGAARIVCVGFATVFGIVEGLFFVANLSKFTHGGWFCVLIGGVLAAVMIVWHNSSRKRASYIDYKELGEHLPVIESVKHDDTIPKYTSNLVYFSRSEMTDMIESKLLYSIINKQPKRADHYWFVHIDYTDAPDTLEYNVEIPLAETIYVVTMRIGYRVEPSVSVYLRQVVEDLVSEGKLDLRSGYPSLRKQGIPGDFKFIILHRMFSPTSSCTRSEKMLMRMHDLIRHIGISDQKALRLDTSMVTLETVPLIINSAPLRRIVPQGD